MEFKRTVAGISAAAIAVTQVAAVVPMSAFAANTPVESGVGLDLKLSSKTTSGETVTQVKNGAAAAKSAVIKANEITAADTNNTLAFSYSGSLTDTSGFEDGDQFRFTATNFTVVADGVEKTVTGARTAVLENADVDLDGSTTEEETVSVASIGASGDTVVITYSGEGTLSVKQTNDDAIEDKDSSITTYTFVLDETSKDGFKIVGKNVTISAINVTTSETSDLMNEDANSAFKTDAALTDANNGVAIAYGEATVAVGDKVVVTYAATGELTGAASHVSRFDTAGKDTDDGVTDEASDPHTYTFTVGEAEKSGFSLYGNEYTISKIELTHYNTVEKTETALSGNTELGIPNSVSVAKTAFDGSGSVTAAAEGALLVGLTINDPEANGSITIKAGNTVITEDETISNTDGSYQTGSLTSEQAEAIKTNGITITGSNITVGTVEYITPDSKIDIPDATLIETIANKEWTQTWNVVDDIGGWSTPEQTIDVSKISDKISTVAAFKENYKNITVSWDSLTCEKIVADPEPDPTYDIGGSFGEGGVDIGEGLTFNAKNDVAENGTITVTLNAGADGIYKLVKKSDKSELVTGTNDGTTVTFTLNGTAATEIAANGFILTGAGAVKSVAYADKEEEPPVDKTAIITEFNNESVSADKLTNAAKVKFTFNVTKFEAADVGLTFYVNSDAGWKQVFKTAYDSSEITGTGEMTAEVEFGLGKYTWYQAGVKTSDPDVLNGELVKAEFLDADGKVVATYDPNEPVISSKNFTFSTLSNEEMKVGDTFTIAYDSKNTPEKTKYRIKYKIYAPNDPDAWEKYIYPTVVEDGTVDNGAKSKTGLKVSKSVEGTVTTFTFEAVSTSTVDAPFSICIEYSANGTWLDTSYPYFGDVSFFVPEVPSEDGTKITDITKDTNFQKVLKLYDANNDKALTATEIAAITELGTEKKDEKFKDEASLLAKVKNFAGIEKLTALTTLVVKDSTAVTALDLSKNEALVSLDLTGCTKLADLKLPATATVTKLALSGTAITAIDVSKYTELTDLDVSATKITDLTLTANTKLVTLNASSCGLTKIDVSTNTALTKLDVSKNNLVALNLTGLSALTELKADGNAKTFGKVLDGVYDLSKLGEFGLAAENMTIKTEGVTKGEGLTLNNVTGDVVYEYATGLDKDGLNKVTFTLTPENITAVNYVLKYNDGKEDKAVDFEKWDDVLKAINNKNIAYTIELKKDVNIDTLKFPAAAKAKSVTIDGEKTITTKSTSVALPTDVTLKDVTIKAVDKDGKTAAKSLTLTASKNLTIDHLNLDATATTIKGGAKSVLNVADETIVNSIVSGFGTLKLDAEASATFNKNVTVKELIINNAGVLVGENAVLKFTNINCSNGGGIMYTSEKFIPVAVTNITGEGKLQILISYEKAVTVEEVTQTTTVEEFTAGNVVLNSKTVDLSKIDASLTEGTTLGKSGKSGNEVTVMATVMDVNGVKYGQWSDVLSTIAAKAKADKNAAASIDYVVTLFNGLDAKGALKMPAAKTYKSLTFKSADEAETQTITFKGNLSLTGNTTFEKVKLVSDKDFSISAAKNELTLKNVTAEKKIKSISSSGVVNLEKVTVSAVSAATVNVTTPAVVSEPGGGNAIGSVNAWVENKAVADKSSVFVDGNLTAKTALNLNGTASSLTVNGVLNAAEIKAEKSDAVLVVKQPAKGNALVIGKNGFNGTSKQIKFVLADADGNAAKITDVVTLGTIAGTYADDLLPSNDNLVKDDTYYIVKEGKNLKAVPKTSVTATDEITVTINGKPARYKNIDEAIKDISASGKATDNVAIMITANTFKDTIAKLPLPTAGKYKTLTYEAASPVTIKVSSDLALTGNLNIDSDITINKVGKDGKTTAISVNVGKYQFATLGLLSATTDEAPKGQIANISGNGLFTTDENVIVTGKVNGTTLVLRGNTVKLEGDKASFAGGIHTTANSTLAYTNAKNVKFTSVKGERNTSLTLTTTATENAIIAAITGDYTKDAVKISGSELKVVRSGNNLKAVKAENVVEVKAYEGKPTTRGTRTYDTLANAMNDISRIKDATAEYLVYVKNGDELVLPKAKTYRVLGIGTKDDKKAEIKTLKDLALTGTLILSDKVTLNKVDKKGTVQPISVNVGGDYYLHVAGKLSPKDGVSQIVNISGKGAFLSENAVNVTGKVNVGWYIATSTTLGAKSSFAASTIGAYSDFTFNYPMSIAKNVKFGSFDGDGLKLNIDGIKEGQIATLTGDFADDSVVIGDDTKYKAVRSGNKLMAVKADAEVVSVSDGSKTRVYDTYANAVADINRINKANAKYTVTLPGDMNASKLALPAKGKYKSIKLVANKVVTIDVKGDIALTGDLVIGENVTLRKDGGKKTLKITSPKGKDKNPLYKVSTELNGRIVNSIGETVVEKDKVYTLGEDLGNGIDLSENDIKFVKANVAVGGKIVVTFKEKVTGRVVICGYDLTIEDEIDLAAADVNDETTAEFTLDSDAAKKMSKGDFYISGVRGFEGVVTSVKYVAPPTYNVGQDFDEEGVAIGEYGLIFNKYEDAAKGYTIFVDLKEAVEGTYKLTTKDGTEIVTGEVDGDTVRFTLTETAAAEIAANGFVLTGTSTAVVVSVTYGLVK